MELRSRDCLRQVMAIQGVIGASLVDYASGLVIDSTGREPSDAHEVTAAGVTDVVNAALGGATFTAAAEPGRIDDIVMTAGNGYHLVYFVGVPWRCSRSRTRSKTFSSRWVRNIT